MLRVARNRLAGKLDSDQHCDKLVVLRHPFQLLRTHNVDNEPDDAAPLVREADQAAATQLDEA